MRGDSPFWQRQDRPKWSRRLIPALRATHFHRSIRELEEDQPQEESTAPNARAHWHLVDVRRRKFQEVLRRSTVELIESAARDDAAGFGRTAGERGSGVGSVPCAGMEKPVRCSTGYDLAVSRL